jgi:hypothetical protein
MHPQNILQNKLFFRAAVIDSIMSVMGRIKLTQIATIRYNKGPPDERP